MEIVTRIAIGFLLPYLVFYCCFLAGPGSQAYQMHEKWRCDHDHTDFVHDVSAILYISLCIYIGQRTWKLRRNVVMRAIPLQITYKVHVESEHHHHVKKRALDQPFRVSVHYDSTVEDKWATKWTSASYSYAHMHAGARKAVDIKYILLPKGSTGLWKYVRYVYRRRTIKSMVLLIFLRT